MIWGLGHLGIEAAAVVSPVILWLSPRWVARCGFLSFRFLAMGVTFGLVRVSRKSPQWGFGGWDWNYSYLNLVFYT